MEVIYSQSASRALDSVKRRDEKVVEFATSGFSADAGSCRRHGAAGFYQAGE